MMFFRRTPSSLALGTGCAALALLAGALGFQYLVRLPPCEMCMWQRYPHIVAAVIGIGAFLLARAHMIAERAAVPLAIVAVAFVAVSGAIGVYHAGVEWQWWPGPQACTGAAFQSLGGPLDLNAPVVRCDHAAWRLLGISLAGYNAILSFAIAGAGAYGIGKSGRAR